jgi:hypothetical protein
MGILKMNTLYTLPTLQEKYTSIHRNKYIATKPLKPEERERKSGSGLV